MEKKNWRFYKKSWEFYFFPFKIKQAPFSIEESHTKTTGKLGMETRSGLADVWELGTKTLKFIEHKQKSRFNTTLQVYHFLVPAILIFLAS